MRCDICAEIEGQGECSRCKALAAEMAANDIALHALRYEQMPIPVFVPSRRKRIYAMAAAAVLLTTVSLSIFRFGKGEEKNSGPMVQRSSAAPLQIRLLTADPDVVVLWQIDPNEAAE
jgi:hypothetical protein